MEKVRQREIKFRCFYNGKMYPVLELHGEDSMTVNGIKMHLDGLGERVVSPDLEHIEGVMQYTGLKDKNGKEIYEGDIVRWHSTFRGASQKEHVDKIEWQDTHACFLLMPYVHEPHAAEMEVIGNIYEHPHLLSQWEIKTELI